MKVLNRPGMRRGGALLAVLWLAAALAAVAFSAAQIVRAGRERTINQVEGVQAALLASAATERGLLHMRWGGSVRLPDGRPKFWDGEQPYVRLVFPSGEALVAFVPESSKMDVNGASDEALTRLGVALGLAPPAAQQISAAIVHWRTRTDELSALDGWYLRVNPTFRAPHTSFQQIEELLSVYGITPDLYYGGIVRTADGAWYARPGLRDCLSVFGRKSGFDAATVRPEVLAASGVSARTITAILGFRQQLPITRERWQAFAGTLGSEATAVRWGAGSNVYTIRATARVRRADGSLSELRRSATLTVLLGPSYDRSGYRIIDSRSGASTRPLALDPVEAAWR